MTHRRARICPALRPAPPAALHRRGLLACGNSRMSNLKGDRRLRDLSPLEDRAYQRSGSVGALNEPLAY